MEISTPALNAVLDHTNFPAPKAQLIQQARADEAGDAVLDRLDALPDREYQDPSDVKSQLSKSLES